MKTPWLLVIPVIYLIALLSFGQQRTTVQRADAWGYYLHLPSAFIYHDAGNYDRSIDAWHNYFPFEGNPKEGKYSIRQTLSGKYAIKYPVGVAILELPFFAAAHVWCTVTGTSPADGFSPPYHIAVGWASFVYALLGLWMLFLTARKYVGEQTAMLGIGVIALGTPLFHYATAQGGMAHPFLFFLIAGLVYVLEGWRQLKTIQYAIYTGLCLGLIAASRLPEIIVGVMLIPVLWKTNWRNFMAFAVAAAIAFLPQLCYQKFISGQWMYNSYAGETFDWLHPHITDGLFHYSNGWLVYSPVMVFAIAGLFQMRQRIWSGFWPVCVFLPLHIYICYAWWCWNYINGFGSRPMVEAGALLLFPLLAFLQFVQRNGWLKWIIYPILLFCCALNIFQTWQQNEQILWSERANAAYFRQVFGQTHRSENALIALESNELQPDTSQLFFVRRLMYDAAEDSTEERYRRRYAHSGQFSFRVNSEFAMGGPVFADTSGIEPGQYIKVSVWSYVQEEERLRDIDKLAKLVIDFNDGQGHVFKIPGITITSKTGNPEHIPWHTGASGVWGKAEFFAKVPDEFTANSMIKAYIWNPGGQKFFADDFLVEAYRVK